MESQAATKQSRSGLVVRESKLFQEGGRVTASCSRKKCCRVSFVVAALIQGVLVIGLQVAIVIVGLKQFEDSPVEVELTQNCDCEREVLDLLDYNLNVSTVVESSQFCSTLNSTSTLNGSSTLMEVASLGKDKLTYAIFFIAFVLYNFSSLSLAVYTKSIIDVYFSLLLSALLVIYSFVQVYQFRSFNGDGLEVVGYIALSNALVLLLFMFVFGAFTGEMHTEFGWWTFTWFKSPAARQEGSRISLQIEGEGPEEERENAKKQDHMKVHTSHLRFYYRYYRITVGVSWLVLLFHLTFFVGELALFLPVECDFEGPLTILLIFALPVILLLGYIAVRNEYRLLTLAIGLCLCLSVVFFLFKVIRFATRQCPRCRLRQFISDLLHADEGEIDRNQQLEHLVLFSVLNLVGIIVLLIMIAIVTLNYNKGLGDHFRQRWTDKKGWRKHLDLSFSIPAAIKWMCCRCCGTHQRRDVTANT